MCYEVGTHEPALLIEHYLPGNSQGLSHRLANRYKGVLLRRGGPEHPVVSYGNRQPGVGIRPPDRSTSTGMAKDTRAGVAAANAGKFTVS